MIRQIAHFLFIHPNENRLRAGWRLLLHYIFYNAGVLTAVLASGAVVLLLKNLSGAEISLNQLVLEISSHPLSRPAGALISLLVMTLSLLVFARWVDRRPLKAYGFRFSPRWWADLGFGLFLGAFLMALVFFVERAAGWVTVTGYFTSAYTGLPFGAAVLADLVVFLCVGIYEEMLSRGYQTRNLAEGLNFQVVGPRAALVLAFVVTSVVFGWLHALNPNATLTSTLALMVAGLFLGLGYILTGELAIPIGLHITWNFFQGSVFGFPVSGTGTAATFISIQQGGPAGWTGGAFGPEAGWIGLLAIALGSLMTILWVRLRRGRLGLQEGIARYQPEEGPYPPAA